MLRIDCYDVVDCIGDGGFGRVYRCKDAASAHPDIYALKVLKDAHGGDPAILRLFEGEAKRYRRIQHPFLPRFFRFFSAANGNICILMEYIKGEPLSNFLRRNPDPDLLKNLFRQVVEAIGYLHDQEPPILHMDIKPDHILVVNQWDRPIRAYGKDYGSPQQYPVILDLGTASTVNKRSELLILTEGYAAPEYLHSRETTKQCDIYSLGITLKEMVVLCRESSTGYDTKSIRTERELLAAAEAMTRLAPSERPEDLGRVDALLTRREKWRIAFGVAAACLGVAILVSVLVTAFLLLRKTETTGGGPSAGEWQGGPHLSATVAQSKGDGGDGGSPAPHDCLPPPDETNHIRWIKDNWERGVKNCEQQYMQDSRLYSEWKNAKSQVEYEAMLYRGHGK